MGRWVSQLKLNRWFWMTQGLIILFSLAGATVKTASLQMQEHGFFSPKTLFAIACFVSLMMFYAFFWQKIIAHLPLSVAYLGKSLDIFWALVWSHLFFGESIGVQNLIGAFVIFTGMLLVVQDE